VCWPPVSTRACPHSSRADKSALAAAALVHSSGSISGVVYLNLSSNAVGDAGAAAVAEVLRGNDSVQVWGAGLLLLTRPR
jgi:hypothetical protein